MLTQQRLEKDNLFLSLNFIDKPVCSGCVSVRRNSTYTFLIFVWFVGNELKTPVDKDTIC